VQFDGRVTLWPLILKTAHPLAPGLVKVAVRPESWQIGAAVGLEGTLRKISYLGNAYEYSFDTAIGPVFVLSNDLARPLAAGAETTLSLGLHGVSVVPGSA